MDVIDVLGDLLTDLEKTASKSATPSPRPPKDAPIRINVDSPRALSNGSVRNANLLSPNPVEPSFLYAPDRDILTGEPLIRTPSPGGGSLLSPKLYSPRPGSAASWRNVDASESTPVPTFGVNDSNDDFKFQSYHLDYKYTPPPIKGPCCVCGEGIMGAMVTALDKMWHPEHFTCVHCGIELRSPMYLEHDGKPYCKICHGKLFLPPCAECKKDIAGNYITAMNKIWHPDCFKCARCRKVLTPNNFYPKDGKPYCEDDFHDLFSPKCFACKKPIKDQDRMIVVGQRQWHPEHFKCCQCGCQLKPDNFKEKNGKLYCEKDYNDLFMPKCAGCFTPIVTPPTTAMGKTWHPKCFNCTECKKQLNPERFFEKNGKPYCEDDFHKLFSPKCAGCRAPIKDSNKMTNAQGKTWHPGCFTCTECKKILSPHNFFEKNGLPYCEDDFHKLFSPKCAGCGGPIKDPRDMVEALGKKWHRDHFNCTECGKILTPQNFFEKDGLPYCEDDFHKLFSPRCTGCGQPIKDKYVFAMNSYWHPEHFTCHQCGRPLRENEFYEKDGRVYCLDDFLNLFAPKCVACRLPIKDEYCLGALEGDWHPNCFRCKDCKCLLEDRNFYEIDGEPYCEEHFHARQCPDCIKMRRAQNQYFGLPPSTPMGPSRWASQVSLKSLTETTTATNYINGEDVCDELRPVSQLSQYSTASYDTAYSGGRSTPSRCHIIPIEREGYSGTLKGQQQHQNHVGSSWSCNSHDHDSQSICSSDFQSLGQRSSLKRSSHLAGSRSNLQYVARNENPYNYLEPGKFPVETKHIRFSDTVTKREFQKEAKYY